MFEMETNIVRLFFKGKMPYTGLIAREIVEFLREGKKLSKPEGCPNEM